MLETHEPYMRAALEEAKKSINHGDIPVGCVIVQNEKIIGRGHNRREELGDASAHAEIEAIRDACQNLRSWRLSDASLYVTLEPCPMCAGGIINARIPVICYGTKEENMGCCGSVINIFEERFHHHPRIYGGVLESECKKLLRDFFQAHVRSINQNDTSFPPVRFHDFDLKGYDNIPAESAAHDC